MASPCLQSAKGIITHHEELSKKREYEMKRNKVKEGKGILRRRDSIG